MGFTFAACVTLSYFIRAKISNKIMFFFLIKKIYFEEKNLAFYGMPQYLSELNFLYFV